MEPIFEKIDQCILCESTDLAVFCQQNRFTQCLSCGLVFDNPRPTFDSIVNYYSKESQYDHWLQQESGRQSLFKRRLKRVRKFAKSGQLLDVGAGIGEFLHYAKDHFTVTGTEISSSAIEHAKKLYSIDLIQGTLEQVKFETHFDVITMFHVLEHVPFPGKTIELSLRLLKPRGILVIAVPNDIDCFSSWKNRVLRKKGIKKYDAFGEAGLQALNIDMPEIHLSHFRLHTLLAHFQKYGITVLDSGLDPYFADSGMLKVKSYIRYFRNIIFFKLAKKNIYDTLWITVRKP